MSARGKDPAGEGSVTCVQQRSVADNPIFAKVKSWLGRKKLTGACVSDVHSHVRHFKQQAQNFFSRASSCSVRPLLGMAGGTIIKRRLIML